MDVLPADLATRLAAFVASAAADEAVAARVRQHWLQRAAVEEGSVRGVLLDLAELGSVVAVQTAGGRRHRARVRAVGLDFAAMRTEASVDVIVAVDAVAWLRPDGATAPVGDRSGDLGLTLAGALAAIAAERPRVSFGFRGGGDPVAGELRDVGRDLLVIRPDGDPQARTYVPFAALADVMVVG